MSISSPAGSFDDSDARRVLDYAGFPADTTLMRAIGGFSDAAVWRVDCQTATFALKAYPVSAHGPTGLRSIHNLLEVGRDAGIIALPRVSRRWSNQSSIRHGGASWDLVSWQPGNPSLQENPTDLKLKAVGSILARLHNCWEQVEPLSQSSPSVQRRLYALEAWQALRDHCCRHSIMSELADTIDRNHSRARLLLGPWLTQIVAMQPCLCDLWHGHVLFTGDEVTGLIDHASVRIDQPIVDLARLLGSLELAPMKRESLLDGYLKHRGLSDESWKLLRVMELTGIIGGLVHWFERLSNGIALSPAVTARIELLLRKARAIEW